MFLRNNMKFDRTIGWSIVLVLVISLGLQIWNKDFYRSLDQYRLVLLVILVIVLFYQLYVNRQSIIQNPPRYRDLGIMFKGMLWITFILIAAIVVLLVLGYLVS